MDDGRRKPLINLSAVQMRLKMDLDLDESNPPRSTPNRRRLSALGTIRPNGLAGDPALPQFVQFVHEAQKTAEIALHSDEVGPACHKYRRELLGRSFDL